MRLLSGSKDGSLRIWHVETGELLVTLYHFNEEDWLAVTPAGFYAGSQNAGNYLAAVRGFEAYALSQFFQHFYRPDLVEERLAGDPFGRYKDAAFKLDLEKALGSGPAPQVEVVKDRFEVIAGTARVAVRVTDVGGGIGDRIVWKVNGIVKGNVSPPELAGLSSPSLGRAVTVTQVLPLEPGKRSRIEVVAHNGAKIARTQPLVISELGEDVGAEVQPRLFVLAIGVDNYRMDGFKLNHAERDAKRSAPDCSRR